MNGINKRNLETYLLGSQFFGTGGGLPLEKHKKIFLKALERKHNLEFVPITAFNTIDTLATIYGVGDPSQIQDGFASLTLRGLEQFEKLSRLEVKGILPGEIGAEGLAFLCATVLDLPVVDTDLVGARAAPEIQLDTFTVHGVSLTPLLGMAGNGKSLYFQGNYSAQEIEQTLRVFFENNGGSGILVGYPIAAGEYATIGMLGTLTQTLAIGQQIEKGDLKKYIENDCGGMYIEKQKVQIIDLESKDGFLQGKIVTQNYVIEVKNENIQLKSRDGESIVARAPEVIMLLDRQGVPLHNATLKKQFAHEVTIVVLPAKGYWKKSKAMALWYDCA